MMPLNLALARHGESEGNVAVRLSKKHGDDRCYTEEFMSRHSAYWRLSNKGRAQALCAGEWLRQNFLSFDRYYTSEYLRAMETAALLGLKTARWYREFHLRERDRGILDIVPPSELLTKYAEEMKRRASNELLWAPPGGESMATVCLRVDRILDTLHRECAEKNVLIVCHGEVMLAFRIRLERLSTERVLELLESQNSNDQIYNGQIIHYTRRNPDTDEIAPYIKWMRMIRPDHQDFSREWRPIRRPSFTNEELLRVVSATLRLVND